MAQDTGLESELSIWNEMLTVFKDLIEQEKELRRLEAEMAKPDTFDNEILYQKVLNEYDTLQVAFKEKGGYQTSIF